MANEIAEATIVSPAELASAALPYVEATFPAWLQKAMAPQAEQLAQPTQDSVQPGESTARRTSAA